MGVLRDAPLRSVLFTPATRPDRVAKLAETGADLGVIDLEDAVAPSAKASARADAVAGCEALARVAPHVRVVVRVNAPRTDHFAPDVAEALSPHVSGVVVPKVDSADDLRLVRSALADAGRADLDVVAGIESAAGVLRLDEILATGVAAAVYFGAEDYIADLAGERTAAGHEVLYARSHVALVARVHGVRAVDQIVPAYTDDEHFRQDAAQGRAIGYAGKMCIHPRQVPLATAAFSPRPDQVDRAERLVAAYEAAMADGVGVVTFDGQMVDQPMLRHARALLAAARGGRR